MIGVSGRTFVQGTIELDTAQGHVRILIYGLNTLQILATNHLRQFQTAVHGPGRIPANNPIHNPIPTRGLANTEALGFQVLRQANCIDHGRIRLSGQDNKDAGPPFTNLGK